MYVHDINGFQILDQHVDSPYPHAQPGFHFFLTLFWTPLQQIHVNFLTVTSPTPGMPWKDHHGSTLRAGHPKVSTTTGPLHRTSAQHQALPWDLGRPCDATANGSARRKPCTAARSPGFGRLAKAGIVLVVGPSAAREKVELWNEKAIRKKGRKS